MRLSLVPEVQYFEKLNLVLSKKTSVENTIYESLSNLASEHASNYENFASTTKRAVVSILRANRAKAKLCELFKIVTEGQFQFIKTKWGRMLKIIEKEKI